MRIIDVNNRDTEEYLIQLNIVEKDVAFFVNE